MPELPDLLYIQRHLHQHVAGRAITGVAIRRPVVLRVAIDQPLDRLLIGSVLRAFHLRGPFIQCETDRGLDVIINLMVAGRLQYQRLGEKIEGHLCLSLALDDRTHLNMCDDELMAKVYIVPHGKYDPIPRYREQGIDILSPEFTLGRFKEVAERNRRRQVRVFINDQTVLSAIGNAYADEILFEARIHPKTFIRTLSGEEIETLYHSIRSVMEWGREKVERAAQPIHVKVRDHMRVRNRKGEPCPRCGTTIRREGVRGHDVFFCPACQKATRKLFIDWSAAG